MTGRTISRHPATAPAGRGGPRPSPIAYCRAYAARGAFGRYWVLVVENCPLCGQGHTHGGGDQLRPSYGHRAAHCADGRLGGYWLEPAPGDK
ncbi:hypothetical protein [Streptomyces sp. NPDC059909]|uniref:hypothetical protein n=1 Tax=Streptomyces sp. NPDC059909 TaxID=3346998 RepID=UPI0036656B35